MAKENRMSREDYLKECEKVEDTAYAEQGHPQTFGNELLLQNIDAFGTEIARLSTAITVSYTHLTLPTNGEV